jgi:ABC-2 type transport system ATP-binding protein
MMHDMSPSEAAHRVAEMVEAMDVEDFVDVPAGTLSTGQRARAEIAACLLAKPRLVILDEPTVGIDVVHRGSLRDSLLRWREAHGFTLVLTSHNSEDIAALTERVVVLQHGGPWFDGSLAGLLERVDVMKVLRVQLGSPLRDVEDLPCRSWPGVSVRLASPSELLVVMGSSSTHTAWEVIDELGSHFRIVDVELEGQGLDEAIARSFSASEPDVAAS